MTKLEYNAVNGDYTLFCTELPDVNSHPKIVSSLDAGFAGWTYFAYAYGAQKWFIPYKSNWTTRGWCGSPVFREMLEVLQSAFKNLEVEITPRRIRR